MLKQLLESGPAVAVTYDLDGRYRYASRLFLEWLGKETDAVVGNTPADLFPAKTAAASRREHETVLREDRCVYSERVASSAGQLRTFLTARFPLRDAEGRTEGVGLIGLDVTRSHAMERLGMAQRDLGIALSEADTLDEGLAACLDAVISLANTDAAGIYEYDAEQRSLRLRSHKGISQEFAEAVGFYGPGTQQVALIEKGQPLYVPFATVDGPAPDVRRREGLRAMGVIPVQSKQRVIASLCIGSRECDVLDTHTRLAAESIAAQIGNAIVRLRLADSLAASEKQYRMLLHSANDAILIHEFFPDGRPGKILRVNEAACRALGYSAAELCQQELFSLVRPREAEMLPEYGRQLVQSGEVAFETVANRPDGSPIDLDVKARMVRIDGHLVALSIMRDVTAKRLAAKALQRSEQELKELAARLTATSERERQQLSGELHDGIAQTVSGLRYSLEALLRGDTCALSDSCAERIRDAVTGLGDVSNQIRDLISELRPPTLEELGTTSALRLYGERLGRRYGQGITVRGTDSDAGLEEHALLALYRIGQEAMANACKHAAAENIVVSLENHLGGLRLTVEDNGRGFDARHQLAGSTARRVGLTVMKERAAAVGAKLTIASAQGEGTRVTVTASG